MTAEAPDFPWYRVVRGDALEQGDLLFGCPRFVLPAEAAGSAGDVMIARETRGPAALDRRPAPAA